MQNTLEQENSLEEVDIEPLDYGIIEVGNIYEYKVADTTIPVEILEIHKTQIFGKNSNFLSFKLLNLLTDKKFQTGIEQTLLDTVSEECKNYIFKFFPTGTFIKELS